MLKSIEISNYRGIREGRVSGFASVNVIVGRNGSGKSTLLEAIFLGCAGQENFNHINAFGQQGPLISLRHNEHAYPSLDYVYGKRAPNTVVVKYQLSGGRAQFTLLADPQQGWRHALESPDGAGATMFFRGLQLLDIRLLLDKSQELRAWDELLGIRADRALIEVMNEVYGLNVESFTYSAGSQVLKVLFKDREFALNIDDLGAGMRTAFRLFVAMLRRAGSAVMVEEFDSYQHIEALPMLARTLLRLAKRTGAQLFLATHSVETVKAFASEVAQSADASFRLFQTTLSRDGVFEAAGFSAEEALALEKGGLDVRNA